MKKTYISPSFLTVTLNSQNHILQSSKRGLPVDFEDEVTTNFVQEFKVTDTNLWDDEW